MASDILRKAMEYQAREDAKRAAQEAVAPPPAPGTSVPQFAPELIPDVDSPREKSDEDLELDRILDGVGILEAYIKWCGKMTPVAQTGRTEGIKISCPIPGHTDKVPSAWLNTEKNVWTCGPCGMAGGDKYDIAAYHHGFPVPGYKEGALFHKLRRAMGEDLGWSFKEKIGGGYDLVPPVVISAPAPPPAVSVPVQSTPSPAEPDRVGVQSDPVPPPAPPGHLSLVPPATQFGFVPLATGIPPEPDQPLAEVISIDPEVDAYDPELDSDANVPTFAWRDALADYQDTFLWRWCDATSKDHSPEEYHLFSGMLLLGLTSGRDVLMDDGNRPVMANLSICYLGKTGSGKSAAQNYISKAIDVAMPENDLGIMVEGVRFVGEVASGEALIGEFQQVVKGSAMGHVPIKGYVEFSELSGLLAKSSIQGSTLKTKIMDFIDGKYRVSNSSQTHGRKEARNAFAAFSTSSQPRALRKLLDSQDQASGYLNRWLYIAGPVKERESYFGGVQVDLKPALTVLTGIAMDLQKKNPTDPPIVVPVTTAAEDEFKRFFAPIDKMINQSDDDMIARLEIHYKKLMFCHAINRRAKWVDIEDVLFVERLHPYILANFKLVGAQIGKSQGQEFIDRVLNYIKRKEIEFSNGLGPNRSMLYDAMKTKNIGTKQVNEAINDLIKAGFIEEVKVQTGKAGRPPIRLRSVQHG